MDRTARATQSCQALRLFCFPHAGAGSVIFRDWFAAFPDSVLRQQPQRLRELVQRELTLLQR